MNSHFVISQADGRPMYLQLMEQIKQKVAVGDWQPGFKLPSIRELAVEAKVSVITVKRSYLELEREGVIVTRHGKGSYVADTVDLSLQIHQRQLDEHLQESIRLASLLGLTADELAARLIALRSSGAKE